ncbi:MAG TPA: MogA/MoaB family molybdenum cofactor biosynthesis protein [Bacteroidales bacterium]|nr:MogA/MoaB family molybdenum cofactor biosynthesis protein [Bacteroidales bacterium]HPF03049.1 MogA/MoaB family molybdenum cofactor biosynthesis protein [Bacteroidales bacterium]HPJ59859.1 MogA/MoaB family molybdenum cofactor biosynthesis protein [Bacteroidales bacterium]HPR12693.1 MogA/MoaB family molybdenum cofactor biosynthesis protein [Bacteroidales bacterium]HRW86040.1 MogA/MoaB family molybdenum cofactor biosynthesis protein [Bacteroidales bacterium]
MKLPSCFRVLVITLSDRAYRGDYEDISGSRIKEMISGFMANEKWNSEIRLEIMPDEADVLREKFATAASDYDLIFTTGGTGIGPRDITVETVRPFLTREIPGVMEYIRVKYGSNNPNALLSRGVAGLAGDSLVFTLPGSVKAVEEYMTEILRVLKHTLFMLCDIDAHGHGQ